jgi:hypothetical protein
MNAIQFVKIWNSSATIEEVVEQTQLTRGACHARASTYRRKHDIPLKAFSGSSRQNWDAVKEAAQLALNEAQTEETLD